MLNNIFNFPGISKLPSSNYQSVIDSPRELKFNVSQPNVIYDLAVSIRNLMQTAKSTGFEIVVLCIGSDRSTGDALGPLTGSKLKTLNRFQHIYGTLDDPIHATNLENRLESIHNSVTQPFVLAVDACLGKLENVGYVTLGHGSVKPGGRR